jgi:hypothetical protein
VPDRRLTAEAISRRRRSSRASCIRARHIRVWKRFGWCSKTSGGRGCRRAGFSRRALQDLAGGLGCPALLTPRASFSRFAPSVTPPRPARQHPASTGDIATKVATAVACGRRAPVGWCQLTCHGRGGDGDHGPSEDGLTKRLPSGPATTALSRALPPRAGARSRTTRSTRHPTCPRPGCR